MLRAGWHLQKGEKDVLVATDVASKGLDFPNIQHVINYDLPEEIENYVHRIGRTGRSGKTGIATTFINKNQKELILLDLKHLLKEAKQRIPPVLAVPPLRPALLFSLLPFPLPTVTPAEGKTNGSPFSALTPPPSPRMSCSLTHLPTQPTSTRV